MNKLLLLTLRKSSLLRISIFTTSFIISQAIMMIYAIIMARYLGPEEYGYFASGYALVGLWSFFINAGMDAWFLQGRKTIGQARTLAGKILKIKLLIFIIWAPLVVIGINRVSAVKIEFLVICVIDIWFDSLLVTLIYGLNIQQNYQKVAWILTISRLGRLISALFLIKLGFPSLILFALFRLLFTLTGLLMALIALRPAINLWRMDEVKIPYKEIIPFGLSEIFAQVYIMADVSLLALLAGKVEVGLYSPATNIISGLFIIPNSLYLYFVPRLSKKIGVKNEIPDKEILVSLMGFCLVGLILFGGVVVSAEWIIPIVLGSAFEQTKQLLLALSPIVFFKALQFGFISIIVSSGLQKFRLVPQFIAAILNLTLNIFLIPLFGAKGAVLVYNLSEFFLLVGYGFIVLSFWKKWLTNG